MQNGGERRSDLAAKVREVVFGIHGDSRGSLIAIEAGSAELPFPVARCYYIFSTTAGTVRGKHAHKALKQMLICTSGSCVVDCELPDGHVSSHRLDSPTRGLLIEGLVWREMRDFSEGAVLLVLASEHYSELDYIRKYDEFKTVCSDECIHS